MTVKLQTKLARILDCPICILDEDIPASFGASPIIVSFENGARLHATYWRLIKQGRAHVTSFDDQQKYGLLAPIDARADLRAELNNRSCTTLQLDKVTGDLLLNVTDDLTLQIFNFTAYEIWHIVFPDGTREYSNYALATD